jgi:hypothetical protein
LIDTQNGRLLKRHFTIRLENHSSSWVPLIEFCFRSDDRQLAIATPSSRDHDGATELHVWDIEKNAALPSVELPWRSAVRMLGSTSDGAKWVVACRATPAQVATVDTQTGAVGEPLDFPGDVVFFEPVRGRVAVKQDRDLVLYDLTTGREQCRLQGFDEGGPRAISPDGRRLAQVVLRYGTADCQIEIWSMDSGRRVATLDWPRFLGALAFSGDGQRLLAHSAEWPGSQPSQVWDGTPLPEEN